MRKIFRRSLMVAALLAVHPDWTPDQVKGALMLSAVPTKAAPNSLGVGEASLQKALALTGIVVAGAVYLKGAGDRSTIEQPVLARGWGLDAAYASWIEDNVGA